MDVSAFFSLLPDSSPGSPKKVFSVYFRNIRLESRVSGGPHVQFWGSGQCCLDPLQFPRFLVRAHPLLLSPSLWLLRPLGDPIPHIAVTSPSSLRVSLTNGASSSSETSHGTVDLFSPIHPWNHSCLVPSVIHLIPGQPRFMEHFSWVQKVGPCLSQMWPPDWMGGSLASPQLTPGWIPCLPSLRPLIGISRNLPGQVLIHTRLSGNPHVCF